MSSVLVHRTNTSNRKYRKEECVSHCRRMRQYERRGNAQKGVKGARTHRIFRKSSWYIHPIEGIGKTNERKYFKCEKRISYRRHPEHPIECIGRNCTKKGVCIKGEVFK